MLEIRKKWLDNGFNEERSSEKNAPENNGCGVFTEPHGTNKSTVEQEDCTKPKV